MITPKFNYTTEQGAEETKRKRGFTSVDSEPESDLSIVPPMGGKSAYPGVRQALADQLPSAGWLGVSYCPQAEVPCVVTDANRGFISIPFYVLWLDRRSFRTTG